MFTTKIVKSFTAFASSFLVIFTVTAQDTWETIATSKSFTARHKAGFLEIKSVERNKLNAIF